MAKNRVDDFANELLAQVQVLVGDFRLVLDARGSSNFGPSFDKLVGSCTDFQRIADVPLIKDTDVVPGTGTQDVPQVLDWAIEQVARLKGIAEGRDATSIASANLSAALKLLESLKAYGVEVTVSREAPKDKTLTPGWNIPVIIK